MLNVDLSFQTLFVAYDVLVHMGSIVRVKSVLAIADFSQENMSPIMKYSKQSRTVDQAETSSERI